MKRSSGILAVIMAGGCTIGAPPGFSKGDSWQFPLVGPLENGQLVTPVFVNDKGPYLFAIDPDSPYSVIDDGVVSEVKPITQVFDRYDDEQDTSHPTFIAQAVHLRIGNLTVDHHDVWVTHIGTFNVGGRQIRGVIGHDVLADSLIFGFDRDKGVAFLATRKGFVPPGGADELGYRTVTNHTVGGLPPIPRRLVSAQINGTDQSLHLDLGAVPSQLREPRWGDAKLQTIPTKEVLVDEIGTVRQVDHAGVASEVKLDQVAVHGLKIVPFDDRRWDREDLDGTLGLGFFQDYEVWIDFDEKKLYLVPRRGSLVDDVKARIDRWGSAVLSGCAQPACFEVSMMPPPPADPAAPAPAAGGAIVHLQRDPAAKDLNIEIVLQAYGQNGNALSLPLMVAEFPQGADTMTTQLDPAYGDATMKIVDASPFVRACPTAGKGCLYSMAAQ